MNAVDELMRTEKAGDVGGSPRGPQPPVLVIGGTYRWRRMLTNFARKGGREVIEGETVSEALRAQRENGWLEAPHPAVGFVYYDPAWELDHAAAVADRLRRAEPDLALFFVRDLVAQQDGAADASFGSGGREDRDAPPTGTLFFDGPVTYAMFNLAVTNGEMISRRLQLNRRFHVSTHRMLLRLQDQYFAATDRGEAASLDGLFHWIAQEIERLMHCEGFWVLRRDPGEVAWRVAWAPEGQAALTVGEEVLDGPGILERLLESGEPQLFPTEQHHIFGASEIFAEKRWVVVPQRMPLHGVELLWLVDRSRAAAPFRSWELERLAELELATRVTLDAALAYHAGHVRMARFVELAGEAGPRLVDDHWAAAAAAVLGADLVLVRTSNAGMPGVADSSLPRAATAESDALFADLDVRAAMLQAGAMVEDETGQQQGLLGRLGSGPAPSGGQAPLWLYAQFSRELTAMDRGLFRSLEVLLRCGLPDR